MVPCWTPIVAIWVQTSCKLFSFFNTYCLLLNPRKIISNIIIMILILIMARNGLSDWMFVGGIFNSNTIVLLQIIRCGINSTRGHRGSLLVIAIFTIATLQDENWANCNLLIIWTRVVSTSTSGWLEVESFPSYEIPEYSDGTFFFRHSHREGSISKGFYLGGAFIMCSCM